VRTERGRGLEGGIEAAGRKFPVEDLAYRFIGGEVERMAVSDVRDRRRDKVKSKLEGVAIRHAGRGAEIIGGDKDRRTQKAEAKTNSGGYGGCLAYGLARWLVAP